MKNNKIWCKHIKYWSRAAGSDWDGDYPACSGWTFESDESPCGLTNTVSKWKFCPICGTPKPKKLTKKEQAIEKYHKDCAEYGTY